jgi:uncharacterized protein (TIGR00730 family)
MEHDEALRQRMRRIVLRLGVFCGSNAGSRPAYLAAAQSVGRILAQRKIGLVYGGGNVGLMGAVADAALAGGAEVIGVIPRVLETREVAHLGLTELHIVETMGERKALIIERSDAFLALPGGYGTLDELFEAVTWRQLGYHDKPSGLLEVDGLYEGLIAYLKRADADGFVHDAARAKIIIDTDPASLIDALLPATAS